MQTDPSYKKYHWTILILCLPFFLMAAEINSTGNYENQIVSRLTRAFSSRKNIFKYTVQIGIDEIDTDQLSPMIQKARANCSDYIRYTIRDVETNVRGNRFQTEFIFYIKHISTQREDQYVFKKAQKIASNINQWGLNVHQVEKSINDYLVKNLEYDKSLKNESPYQALVTGRTTCLGYALLAQLILDKAGLKNRIITGKLKSRDEGHAWNLVRLEGKWYHLDVTQNDMAYDSGNDMMLYGWYNLSDREISSTHSWERNDYPAASQNYFKTLMTLVGYDSYGKDRYLDLINELNLHYLYDENTVYGIQKLDEKLKDVLKKRGKELSFRTNINFVSIEKIKSRIVGIYKRNPKLARLAPIKKISVQTNNYNRDRMRNTVVAQVNFYYK